MFELKERLWYNIAYHIEQELIYGERAIVPILPEVLQV